VWVIANMLSGEKEETEKVVEAGVIPPLVEVLQLATTDDLICQVCHSFRLIFVFDLITNLHFL